GLDAFMVSSSVLLICAQRLARKLCDNCKQPVQIPEERLLELGYKPEDTTNPQFFTPTPEGCGRCARGYKGRFALLETMPFNDTIKRMVILGKSIQEIKTQAIADGMITLRQAALLNAVRGKTSLEEVARVTLAD